MIEFCRDHYQRAGVRLEDKLDGVDATINGDKELLKQVFLNLLMNAFQACSIGEGLIEVVTDRNDEAGTITVCVLDDGNGIPAKEIESVFRQFFTTKSQGTGLGLSLSRSIVLQHGGDISVESRTGEGTTMTVELPMRNS